MSNLAPETCCLDEVSSTAAQPPSPSTLLADLSDEEEFLDALDKEVRQLEEAGISRDEQAAAVKSLQETKEELQREANQYERRRNEEKGDKENFEDAEPSPIESQRVLDEMSRVDAEEEALEAKEKKKEEDRRRMDDEAAARAKREEAMSKEEKEVREHGNADLYNN